MHEEGGREGNIGLTSDELKLNLNRFSNARGIPINGIYRAAEPSREGMSLSSQKRFDTMHIHIMVR